MAVTYFKETHRGRGGHTALQGKFRTITERMRTFLAFTDSNTDDDSVILAHADCPKVGDQHPNDSSCFARRVIADNVDESKKIWLARVEYSDERQFDISPVIEPAEISWSTQARQKVYVADRNGNAIVNSAGDVFDPPPEGDDSRWVVNVIKNVSTVPAWVLSYRDAINSDAFVIDGVAVGVGQAKIMDLGISKEERRGVFTYRTVSLTIALDSAGWALKVLDHGFRKVVGTTGQRIPCVNSDGSDVTGPVPLDGSGGQLANPSASNVVTLSFNIYKSLPFSVLPLS